VSTAISIIYIAAASFHDYLNREEAYGFISYFGIIFPNFLLYRFLDETNVYESKRVYISNINTNLYHFTKEIEKSFLFF